MSLAARHVRTRSVLTSLLAAVGRHDDRDAAPRDGWEVGGVPCECATQALSKKHERTLFNQ